MWLRNHFTPGTEASVSELADLLHGHALTARINHARLREQLSKDRNTVRGKRPTTFKLRLSSLPELDDQFRQLLGPALPTIEHALIPAALTHATRRYLERVALQINGCYESGFYDGAAILMRRLVETLLIDALEHGGHGTFIKTGHDYLPLSDLIGIAGSGQHLKLARGSARSLERIKAVGDTAAHKRTYNTSKVDIDDVAHELRSVVNELMNLAAIHPTA